MYFTLIRAPKDTRCRRCDEVVRRGEWLSRSWLYVDSMSEDTKIVHYHPTCAIDVDARGAVRAFFPRDGETETEYPTATEAELAALAPVLALAEKRSMAIERLDRDLDSIERGEKVEPWTIEPATDRLGRPRVSVRFGGNASAGNTFTPLFEKHAPDWTVRSSKREYVLVASASTARAGDDPSQPTVAALFGTRCSVKLVANQREKVKAWRAEGLPTPVLWVIGPEVRVPALLDKKVLELRAMLASAGFEADEAIVVSSADADAKGFAAVATALDELLDRGARVEKTATTPIQRAIELLERAIEEERTEAWATALERADALLEEASDDQYAQIAALAARCVGDEASRQLAGEILTEAPPTAATHAANAALLGHALGDKRSKKQEVMIEALCKALSRPRDDKRDLRWLSAIESALVAESGVTKRSTFLTALASEHGDEESAKRLRALAAATKAKAKREMFEECAAAIEARLAPKEPAPKGKRADK
ncbi:MAG: hypothetical protein JNK05_25260 [Myxococcales bacterium]|nr:hypothetical protein [Myxococcales bacterium]